MELLIWMVLLQKSAVDLDHAHLHTTDLRRAWQDSHGGSQELMIRAIAGV